MGLKTNSAGNENEQRNDSCDFVNFVGDASDCSDASSAVSSVVRPVSGPKARGPRVHIFWQKRIRANDVSTPWWYPAQTGGGEMREDRLVFPIMPGVSWRDVTPIELDQTGFTAENTEKSEGEKPRMSRMGTNGKELGNENEQGNDSCEFVSFVANSSDSSAAMSVGVKRSARSKAARAVERAGREALERARAAPTFMSGGLWFEPEVDEQAINDAREKEQADAQAQRAMLKAKQKQATKINPKLTALARELRDQWQERVAPTMTDEAGKYDVRRVIEQKQPTPPLLHAA